ncbi:ABC transporter permease [Anatilimnocola sp. NA78]|uniref:ABC transporter permease n=1 Tax=Anatilimnocola sp. NA78 TaxID=3415683 RepID=UPI003CE5C45A
MLIPLKYNLRNLRVRWMTTITTAFAIGMVVWAMVLVFGLNDGIEYALRISGQPLDLVILRKGADSETSSTIAEATAGELATLVGVARNAENKPLAAAELVTILNKSRRGNGGKTNVIVRGVEAISRELRPDFQIVAGRDLKPGLNEIITSRSMGQRFEGLAIGEKFKINKSDFQVVGFFEAGGSSAESEVWTDIRDLSSARRADEGISSMCMRATDKEMRDKLIKSISEDERFNLKAVDEESFFAEQLQAAVLFKFVVLLITVFLTFGAMFAAANTMFAAVAGRSREIGTLRAMGFHRSAILISFLLESVLICVLGGLLGCLATLPFNGITTGTANMATFSEMNFSFRFGPWVLLRGVLMAALMGIFGGILPAVRAVRLNIVNALRET